jgi:hypothetical protein
MTSYVATLRISYKLREHYLLQAQSNVVHPTGNDEPNGHVAVSRSCSRMKQS